MTRKEAIPQSQIMPVLSIFVQGNFGPVAEKMSYRKAGEQCRGSESGGVRGYFCADVARDLGVMCHIL